RPGITPHLLTSFYIMGGQDHLADGTDHARARGSFRIELRDIYLLNADDPNKVSLRLFGKLDNSVSMTNLSDNWLSTEAGVSILTPQFLDGMRVGITPSYSYTRMDF